MSCVVPKPYDWKKEFHEFIDKLFYSNFNVIRTWVYLIPLIPFIIMTILSPIRMLIIYACVWEIVAWLSIYIKVKEELSK